MTRFVGAVAALLGYAARGLLALASLVLSLVGPVAIVWGLYLAWEPASWIAAGVFLLWLDRRRT